MARVDLSWSNPGNDFYQAVVLQDTAPISSTPSNGTDYSAGDMIGTAQVVYAGSADNTSITMLTNDTTYYYRVFIQNPRKNFSSGTDTQATPEATSGTPPATPGNSNSSDSDSGHTGPLSLLSLFVVLLFSRRRKDMM